MADEEEKGRYRIDAGPFAIGMIAFTACYVLDTTAAMTDEGAWARARAEHDRKPGCVGSTSRPYDKVESFCTTEYVLGIKDRLNTAQ